MEFFDTKKEALEREGIQRLYSHQAQAIEAIQNGRDVVVVTPTASGKTLCYNLPVLNLKLSAPSSKAFYLFPTKALSQDQMVELQSLIERLEKPITTYTSHFYGPRDPNSELHIVLVDNGRSRLRETPRAARTRGRD